MKKNANGKNRGSIAVLTAIFMTVLLSAAAFTTDFAVLYVEKSRLQNAVDSAALAGAQELPDNPITASMTALEYASNNDTTLTKIDITNNNKEIHVSAQKDIPLFFARIFGVNSSLVGAQSGAGVYPASSITGAVPLCITDRNFVYGQEYTLKTAPPEGQTGWYGPVRLDGSGANLYEDALLHGNNLPLSKNQILQIETGNMSGPTRKGLNGRLNSDTRVPKNTFEDHDTYAPQIVYIPVVEVIARMGTAIQEVRILGFAAFFIENVTQSGNDCFITGRFLETMVSLGRESSPLNSGLDDPSSDFGLSSVKLLMN